MTWEIWKARCKAWFEGRLPSPERLQRCICVRIQQALDSTVFPNPMSAEEATVLKQYNLKPRVQIKTPLIVYTDAGQRELYAHVDGASTGSPGFYGGGGCIRDTHGNFKIRFAFSYGLGNSLIAETRAMRDGLQYGFTFSAI